MSKSSEQYIEEYQQDGIFYMSDNYEMEMMYNALLEEQSKEDAIIILDENIKNEKSVNESEEFCF